MVMGWMQKLQTRWKVGSTFQVIVILLVFACTGFTVLFLKRPLFQYLFADGQIPTIASIVYYILILPVYNSFLLLYVLFSDNFIFFGTSK